MPHLLSGRIIKQERKKALQEAVKALGFAPTLAIIQVGKREDSSAYIAGKKQFASEIGAQTEHISFPENAHQDDIIAKIAELNTDKTIHGIIVQIPLPAHIDRDAVIDTINPKKDVDGLTAVNVKYLFEGKEGGFVPATTLGILELLEYYSIPLEGKKVTIVGRSSLVGKPTLLALINENATVTICHRHTADLKEHTKAADILIVAIGKPNFITADFVSPGQVIIDVGINLIDGKMTGDVDTASVEKVVAAITPVPGGIGQMTVVALFENLLQATVL